MLSNLQYLSILFSRSVMLSLEDFHCQTLTSPTESQNLSGESHDGIFVQ